VPISQPAYCARPRHRPEHAAPVFRSTPLSWQARRAIKLAGTAFCWAIGLCLVVGAIALVTRSPGRPVHIAAAAAASHAPRSGSNPQADRDGGQTGLRASSPSPAGPPVGAHHLRPGRRGARRRIQIAVFRGTGNQTTRSFRVSPAKKWALRWSYSCPSQQRGRFLVAEARTASADGASVDEYGAGGSGQTWLRPDGSTHELTVISTCSWIVKVVGIP
jgi:hypothetical protein